MSARVAFFGLVVADIPRSLAFYRHVGLDIPESADELRHVDLELADGIQLVWDSVDTIRSFDPDWSPPSGGHRMAIAIRCSTPAEVDTLYSKLGELGYQQHKQPWDAFWGQRYAIVVDPDGNHVELHALLPTS